MMFGAQSDDPAIRGAAAVPQRDRESRRNSLRPCLGWAEGTEGQWAGHTVTVWAYTILMTA